MDGMKLFAWDDVLRDYTAGIIFAMAHDVEEARRLVYEDTQASYGHYVADQIVGPPDYVYDKPACGICWGGG